MSGTPRIVDNAVVADRTISLAQAALRDSFSVAETFGRFEDKLFMGRANDPVFVRVRKPTFQARSYKLYNDREQPIKTDSIEEQVVQLTVDKDHIYNAVAIRDEVRDFDFQGSYGDLILGQVDVLARKFEHTARNTLTSAPYEYVQYVDYSEAAIKKAMAVGQDALFNALVEARAALGKMGSPVVGTSVYAIAGSDWAAAFRKNQKLTLVNGDNRPEAFANATLGTYAGITIVEDFMLPPNELYVYTKEAFSLWSAAPDVPQGAKNGSTLFKDRLALTWIMDYDSDYARDRSVLWSYTAFGHTKDFVCAYDTNGGLVPSEEQYFIRGAKLVLGTGTNVTPGSRQGSTPGANPESILAKLYLNQPVPAADKGIYADMTYQNILDGKVTKGKAEDLTVNDQVKRTRKAPTAPPGIGG